MNISDTYTENSPIDPIETHEQPQAPHCVPPLPAANPITVPKGLRGWLFFLGISNLSSGIISCLSGVGLIAGIPLIISGSTMMAARTALEDPVDMNEFLLKLRTSVIGMSAVYILSSLIFILMFIILVPLLIIAINTNGPELLELLQL